MKPRQLTICGWGPFRDEVNIDFSVFGDGGLFLITGQTGAGKTTVFDAVTYALYGTMSGNMREKGSVRSDFADADTQTFVRLVMTHDGKEYTVNRNPEYLRPKKRKSGKAAFTKEKENAVLVLPDGAVVEGTAEVNRRLREILVLDEKQFKQISMIAQGEFARMLSAGGAEKTRIFREIFGTGIYSRLADTLKERSGLLYKQVMEYRHRMEEDVRLLQIDDEEWKELTGGEEYHYEAICDFLKKKENDWHKEAAKLQKRGEEKEEELLALNRRISEAQAVNELLRKRQETEEKKDRYLQQEPEQKALLQTRERAEAAEAIAPCLEQLKQLERQCQESRNRLEVQKQDIERLAEEEEVLRELSQKREQLFLAFDLSVQKKEQEQLCSRQQRELSEKEQRLSALRERFLRQDEETAAKRKKYEEADSRYKRAAVGIVARLVKEGEPCPVCGSLEHPHVAELSDSIPREEELAEWKEQYEQAEQERQRLFLQAQTLQVQVTEAKEQLQVLEEKQRELGEGLGKLPLQVLDQVREPYTEERKRLEEKLERFTRLQTMLDEKRLLQEELQQELKRKEAERRKAQEKWEQALCSQGFAGKQEYEESRRSLKERRELERKAVSYREERKAIEELYLHLKQETEGKTYTELSRLQEESERIRVLKKETEEELRILHAREGEAKRIRKALSEYQKKMKPLEQEYGLVRSLDNLANGNNSKRLVFEQYVLAGYFEEILQAANLRLLRMTEGRFELLRASEVSDGRVKDSMEMLVMDYYTGRSRSVKTLSGGESFKASLALALGMSDVIQAESGGIRVEALFVDEGFGALDAESLDQACAVLAGLVGRDKMVGIISHVPELRERIADQIVVEKTNHGSFVRVL
ncbi:MAG: SMC family ATPase [Lachnospiraceae bacterium]|nr:SMC family ATPase [Lachnospiraceae bacterium]